MANPLCLIAKHSKTFFFRVVQSNVFGAAPLAASLHVSPSSVATSGEPRRPGIGLGPNGPKLELQYLANNAKIVRIYH
jgi:hypothetical protein